ncbi:MAG: site-specific integrase [Oscillospiraceae bacterium]|nr:site-specific integrase [Oscillospiraceae bacterium]
MVYKRKDNKGRNLRAGECQRKDGRYQFEYTDADGKQRYVYSWKLEPKDPSPKGKKSRLSLREMEVNILRELEEGRSWASGNVTVIELVKRYVLLKNGVRESTRAGYNTVINFLEKDSFGKRKINEIRLSDAKVWLVMLQNEQGKSYSTIHTIRGVLRPAFRMAVEDDIIRKNPFDFQLSTVIVNDSVTREAITHKQKREFLRFVKEDKHFSRYYDVIYILFFTGMRISEFCGLTAKDIDLKNKTVTINKQLHRTIDMRYIIEPPKSDAGKRVIPIRDDVCSCFQNLLKSMDKKVTPIISDKKGKSYSGFLCLDKNGMPMVALHWEKYFENICNKYNSIYVTKMPKVTPHVCRHTYCSHCASAGMNPKHLQYLMGHSEIGVTMNTYTHVEFESIQREVEALQNDVG